jgi:hypothetical protein
MTSKSGHSNDAEFIWVISIAWPIVTSFIGLSAGVK